MLWKGVAQDSGKEENGLIVGTWRGGEVLIILLASEIISELYFIQKETAEILIYPSLTFWTSFLCFSDKKFCYQEIHVYTHTHKNHPFF